MYWSVKCHQYTTSVSYRLYDPDAFAVDFENIIISVVLFSTLFANGMEICSTSAAHMAVALSRSLFWLFVSCHVCLPDTDLFHVTSVSVTCSVSFAFTVCWLLWIGHCFSFIVSGTVDNLDIDLFNEAVLVH